MQMHIQDILSAIENAVDAVKEPEVSSISDKFFTDLVGSSVTGADYGFVQLMGTGGPFTTTLFASGCHFRIQDWLIWDTTTSHKSSILC